MVNTPTTKPAPFLGLAGFHPLRYKPQLLYLKGCLMKKHERKPRGGAHNVKPEAEKRIQIAVTLSPETIELLKPYTEKSQRGRVIDEAIKAYLDKGNGS
jgi:hypothetical protein